MMEADISLLDGYVIGAKGLYKNLPITIEEVLNENDAIVINNPFWNWDEETICVENDEDYDVPYWITVTKNSITLL